MGTAGQGEGEGRRVIVEVDVEAIVGVEGGRSGPVVLGAEGMEGGEHAGQTETQPLGHRSRAPRVHGVSALQT